MVPRIPGPVRRLVLDGLGRLIHHLLELTEEVRRGLIHAVCRTVSESVEGVLNSVIRSRSNSTHPFEQPHEKWRIPSPSEIEDEEGFNYSKSNDSAALDEPSGQEDEIQRDHPRNQTAANESMSYPTSTGKSSWRLAVATGLSGLATWFSKAGLTPFATATAVLAGAILLFPG